MSYAYGEQQRQQQQDYYDNNGSSGNDGTVPTMYPQPEYQGNGEHGNYPSASYPQQETQQQQRYPPPPLPPRMNNEYAGHSDGYGAETTTQAPQQVHRGNGYPNGTMTTATGTTTAGENPYFGTGSSATAVNPYSFSAYKNNKQGAQQTYQAEAVQRNRFHLTPKAVKRLYWVVPLAILLIILVILFEVYKSDFERWVQPLTNWLQARKSWSWLLPTAILVLLSFPPLFGQEIVLIIVGLTFGLGVAIGIACAGSIVGEALCFIAFKYGFTGYVNRKRASNVKWESTARICEKAGFKGVMLIRYSAIPPHLANPLFATTGMSFWIYNLSVILSLPKQIVFVALGAPSNDGNKGVKVAKVTAIGVVCLVSIYATLWIRKQRNITKAEVRSERAGQLTPHGIHLLPGQAPLSSTDPAKHGGPAGWGYGNGHLNSHHAQQTA